MARGPSARYPRTLILVSHDRDLLNSVPQQICHLEGQQAHRSTAAATTASSAPGRERLVLAEKARARQEAERAHIQSFVDRFRYKASKARQAQSRIKMLEKMEPIAQALIEPEIRFSFPAGSVPAPPLITLDAVAAGYGDSARARPARPAARPRRPDRAAGRATATASRPSPSCWPAGSSRMAGELVTRARGLKVGFFAQHQIEDLEPDADAPSRTSQARAARSEREQQMRARLARFGLGQTRPRRKARHLSGGEKTRLAWR